MRRTLFVLLAFLLSVTGAAADDHGPGVEDLAWMTGTWKGAMGQGGSLEESWAVPTNGSMAALVRGFSPDGTTNMIELISIEEEDDSLVLRLKQWNPGMEPRYEGFQVMKLIESGDRMVRFENTGNGGLAKLGYSRPADDKFVISIELPGGQELDINLDAVK